MLNICDDDGSDFTSGWEVDPPCTADVYNVSRYVPSRVPSSLVITSKLRNCKTPTQSAGDHSPNGVTHVTARSDDSRQVTVLPIERHKPLSASPIKSHSATLQIPSPPRVNSLHDNKSPTYYRRCNHYSSASETDDITEYLSMSRDKNSMKRLKMYAKNGTTARTCGYRAPKLHEIRENRLKERDRLLEGSLYSRGDIRSGRDSAKSSHAASSLRESIRAAQAVEGWDDRLVVAKSRATNVVKKSPFDVETDNKRSVLRVFQIKRKLPPQPQKGGSLFDADEVSKSFDTELIVPHDSGPYGDCPDVSISHSTNGNTTVEVHNSPHVDAKPLSMIQPCNEKQKQQYDSESYDSSPLIRPKSYSVTFGKHHHMRPLQESSSYNKGIILSFRPTATKRERRASSLPHKEDRDSSSASYSRGRILYNCQDSKNDKAIITKKVSLSKLTHMASNNERRENNHGNKLDVHLPNDKHYMSPFSPFRKGRLGILQQSPTKQTQQEKSDRQREPNPVTEDEQVSLQRELDDANDVINTIHHQIDDVRRKRADMSVTAKSMQSEIETNLTEIEVLNSQVKVKERELYALQKRQKNKLSLIRQLDLKEKQIRDSEKMYKAITIRLGKHREAKPADSEELNSLITYPVGSDIKQKLRIATEKRIDAQKSSELMKRTRLDLLRDIETLKEQQYINSLREQQRQKEATLKAAAKEALKEEMITKAEEEITRLKETINTYAKRHKGVQIHIEEMKKEAEKITVEAEKIVTDNKELTKEINDLTVNVNRANTEQEGIHTQEQDLRNHLQELRSKQNAMKVEHELKKKQLQTIYNMISSVNAENKYEHLQGSDVNKTIEHLSVVKERCKQEIVLLQIQLQNIIDETKNVNGRLSVLNSELRTFEVNGNTSVNGECSTVTEEGLKKTIESLDAEIVKIQLGREEAIRKQQLAKRKLEEESKAKDIEIEQATRKLNAIVNMYEKKSKYNTTLLEQLDVAERLVRMYNLK